MPAIRVVRDDGQAEPWQVAGPLPYARQPHEALIQLPSKGPAYHVLGALLFYHRPGSDTLDVADEDLAARIEGHPSRPTIQRGLKALEEGGWIARVRAHGRRRITLLFDLKGASPVRHACISGEAPAPPARDMHVLPLRRPLQKKGGKTIQEPPAASRPSGGGPTPAAEEPEDTAAAAEVRALIARAAAATALDGRRPRAPRTPTAPLWPGDLASLPTAFLVAAQAQWRWYAGRVEGPEQLAARARLDQLVTEQARRAMTAATAAAFDGQAEEDRRKATAAEPPTTGPRRPSESREQPCPQRPDSTSQTATESRGENRSEHNAQT